MIGSRPTRVLVVDDHKLVRKGLRTFISTTDDVDLVGEATNGKEAIEQCAELHPDVVLMDLKMPVMDGPTAIAHIRDRFPKVNVIALTTFEDESLVRQAMDAGAISYLLKDADEQELVTAIRLAHDGQTVLAPEAMKALIDRARTDDGSPYQPDMTDREHDVLRLVARGFTNRQIAERLLISNSTVNFHVHNILDKLGAKTRTEAVSIAVREGLIAI